MERALKAMVWVVMLVFMFMSLGMISDYALAVGEDLEPASLTYSGVVMLPWLMLLVIFIAGGMWAFKEDNG